jgi:aminoglycoside/choline kinase family phosphotransferase
VTAVPETGTDPAERLHRFLDRTGVAGRRPMVTPLTGDASDRRYFRVTVGGEPSQIAAVHAGAFEFERLPFVVVGRLLEAMPVRTPRVLGHDDQLGVLMLEDLGDLTLQARLAAASTAERSSLYRQAIGIITTLQRRGRQLASPDLLPYQLAFDIEKLMFELRFFTTHFLEAHRGASLSDATRADLEDEFTAIARDLAAEPRVLCHRDYHSRNLMVHDGHLYVIDFQDARLGPDTYDLVSLLRDAYVDFAGEEVDELVAAFLAAAQIGGAAAGDFWRRFDLMTVQRTLKALGTFGFQATSRGNDRYLENVPRTLSVLRTALAAYPRFSSLHRQLSAYIPELV